MQPHFGDDELEAVKEVFDASWPGTGPRLKQFAANFASHLGVTSEQLLGVTSCTEGLFQICDALQFAPDDEVIMPTISFIGAAHAVRAAGAKIRLVDVDPETLNPTVDAVRAATTPKTKAIIVLHYGGRAGDIASIAEFARNAGLFLIEDAACGLGGHHQGRALGTFADAGTWSFDAMKLLSAGDGGMIFLRDEELRGRVERNIFLGGNNTGNANAGNAVDRWWEMDPETVGRRSVMNDLTAAIANAQLSQIDKFVAARRRIHDEYERAFSNLNPPIVRSALQSGDVPYFYWVQLQSGQRNRVAQEMLRVGV